jgi:hypothetical protein
MRDRKWMLETEIEILGWQGLGLAHPAFPGRPKVSGQEFTRVPRFIARARNPDCHSDPRRHQMRRMLDADGQFGLEAEAA